MYGIAVTPALFHATTRGIAVADRGYRPRRGGPRAGGSTAQDLGQGFGIAVAGIAPDLAPEEAGETGTGPGDAVFDQDVHQARDLIRVAAATSRYIYLPLPIKVVASQQPLDGCIAMKIRLKAYVLDTKYEKDFQTDIVLRAHRSFAENKILPPAALH